MSVLTTARFRVIYPEFTVELYSDDRVEYHFELAQEIFCGSANAQYALTAHMLTLATKEATGQTGGSVSTSIVGTVSKARVGRISTEFVNMAKTAEDSYYEQTPYGKLYLALRGTRRFATRVY
jgi:hypothetical protein